MNWKKILPYASIIVFLLILSIGLFPDSFSGKVINQPDLANYVGMGTDTKAYKEETGEVAVARQGGEGISGGGSSSGGGVSELSGMPAGCETSLVPLVSGGGPSSGITKPSRGSVPFSGGSSPWEVNDGSGVVGKRGGATSGT